jgi:hypothetical protein
VVDRLGAIISGMGKRLLQREPLVRDGVTWTVMEHLADLDIQDPSAVQKMTHEQRLAFAVMGSSYPRDINERERVVDQLDVDSPQLLDDLDQRWYALEAEQSADELLDRFIWSHKASFFV